MPITPINRTKNTITPLGKAKTFNGVYGIAVYGLSTYGTGYAGGGFFINRIKTPPLAGTWADQTSAWSTMLGTWASYISTGLSAWANRNKN